MSVYTMSLKTPHYQGNMLLELDDNNPNESSVLGFLRSGRFYESDVSAFLINVLRQGDTVVDVGANIGFFTVLASCIVGPSGTVASFEPDEKNREKLLHNLKLNNIEKPLIIEKPASNCIEEVEFFFNSDDPGGHALWDPALYSRNAKSQAQKSSRMVQTVTLESALSEKSIEQIKVIKVDTEGAEQLVLEGASSFLKDCKVPFVITELHEFGLEKMGCSQKSLRGLMESFGYSTFALSYDGKLPKFIPPKTEISSKYFVNMLFTTPDMLSEYWPIEEIQP